MFIGTREVEKVDGNIVTFKDGDIERHTEVSLKYLLSEEPKDDSELQQESIEHITQDILNVMELHNARFSDLSSIFNQAKMSCDMFEDRLIAKASGLSGRYKGDVIRQKRNIRVLDVKDFLNT